MKRFSILLALALASFASLAACGDDPREQVTLVVAASDAVVNAGTHVDVAFYDGETTPPGALNTQSVDSPAWPLTFALLPRTTREFVAVVSVKDAGGLVIATETARVRFASGRTKLYRMDLDVPRIACAGFACPVGDECQSSQNTPSCSPVAAVDAVDLPNIPSSGALTSPCAATSCSTGQTCALGHGLPTCGCAFPRSGPSCETCQAGWQLVGGACVPACQGACGAHEVCDGALDVPECRCAIGYADDGTGCTWVGGGVNGGGILDEQLADASKWMTNRGTFDPTLFAPNDGGMTFAAFGICGSSLLAQRIQMPARAEAEPFLLEVTVRSNDTNFNGDTFVQARVGDSFVPLTFTGNGAMIGTACLGANGYGPNVDISLIPDARSNTTLCLDEMGVLYQPPVTIDRVRLVPTNASVCPSVGVRDGSFATLGTPSWTFNVTNNGYVGTSSGAGGVATIDLTHFCQNASFTQPAVSFPTAAEVPNPALVFSANATAYAIMQVALSSGSATSGFSLLGSVVGTGAPGTAVFCLPPSVAGSTRDLRFSTRDGVGSCGATYARTFTIDDVGIVSEPSCTGNTTGFDGTFERGAYATPFQLSETDSGSLHQYAGATIDAPEAHTGMGVFRVDDRGQLLPQYASGNFDIPRATATARPQLRYWYRIGGTGAGSVRVGSGSPPTSTGTSQWTEYTYCIDSELGGQTIPIPFVFNWTTTTNQFIDDVSVVLSPNCP